MPLFRKGSTKGTDYKARLERKLYLVILQPLLELFHLMVFQFN